MRQRLLILVPVVVVIVVVLLDVVAAIPRPVEQPRFLTKKSCKFPGDGCSCVIRLRSECCCKGRTVSALPSNLTSSIRVLVMFNTSIPDISANFFTAYPQLEEIDIHSFPNMTNFDGASLKNLVELRKFSITACKNLEEISDVLLEKNLKMQSLILRDNGLERLPKLVMTDEHKMEVDIDISHNEIKYIGDVRVNNVRAKTLRLNHNRLKDIAGFAFKGSSFYRLYLDNNEELADLSSDSFKDISEMHHLDLSNTIIEELPINGLKNLKSLTLRNVPTLKRLPSVLSFTQLETAHFTYPHHCCLFKYVDDVVEDENGMYKNNMKEIHQRMCTKTEENSNIGHNKRKKTRRKRKASMVTSPSDDMFNLFDPAWFFPDDALATLPTIDDDDDLPEFSSDQLGATRCLEAKKTSLQKFYHNITCTPQPDALNPCENIVGYPLLRRAIWFVWTLAIMGNILVWITLGLAFEKRLRVHYLFMINLSIADLITGLYLGLLAIEDVRTTDEYYRHAVEWQTGFGCKTAGFLAVFASQLSIISMFFIAFEMAYNTRMGFYGRRLTPRDGWIMLIGGWIFSTVTASLPLLGISSYSTTSICLPLKVETIADRAYIISGLMFNVIAFACMAICYAFIIKMLKDPSTPSRDEDKAIIIKMALLIGTDLLCWFPTLFFGITAAIGIPLISISNAKIFLVFFFPINAFANPFLYVFFTEIIQRKVKMKTSPLLRRIKSTPALALRRFSSMSNFYHSQPPGRRDDPASPSRLRVTQITSVNSTPRNSNCSTHKTVESLDPPYDFTVPKGTSTSPRVSFQDEICYCPSPTSSMESTRKSFGVLKRISAIPEVSDLSEHSSESHHEHIPKRRSSDKLMKLTRVINRYRHESAKSTGQDSGRGSIASTVTGNTERNSLNGVTESDGESTTTKLIFPPSSSSGRLLKNFPLTRRFVSRRQSAPLIRPAVTLTECVDIADDAV